VELAAGLDDPVVFVAPVMAATAESLGGPEVSAAKARPFPPVFCLLPVRNPGVVNPLMTSPSVSLCREHKSR
jgi:hypothetical protein